MGSRTSEPSGSQGLSNGDSVVRVNSRTKRTRESKSRRSREERSPGGEEQLEQLLDQSALPPDLQESFTELPRRRRLKTQDSQDMFAESLERSKEVVVSGGEELGGQNSTTQADVCDGGPEGGAVGQRNQECPSRPW